MAQPASAAPTAQNNAQSGPEGTAIYEAGRFT